MTFLAAPIWNQIAQTQDLQTEAAKVAFRLTQNQIGRMENLWLKLETQAGTPPRVARCLLTCLPLLTESEAIQAYVSEHPELRNALPEINDPQEAVDLMTLDYRLNPEDQTNLLSRLTDPQMSLRRWLGAANSVRNPGSPNAPKFN